MIPIAPGHRVLLRGDDIEVEADDDRSRLRPALERHLIVRGGEIHLGDRPASALTAFEARFLSDNDVPLRLPESSSFRPLTDLHTHFAAVLDGDGLVTLAMRGGVHVPRELLTTAGIEVAAAGDTVDIAALDPRARARLGRSLDVPLDRQIPFVDMERLYARRSVFTKHAALFLPQLEAIAASYARAGVRHAELSLSTCLDGDILPLLHAHLDELEARYGVRLRFLVALSRHDDLEWDLDVLDRFEQCLDCRAVVGVDIMGHETNSTRAFVRVLERAASLGARRPGIVVRVHAGENPAFPENVPEALRVLLPFAGVEIRIGHGLFGVDDQTLAAIAREPRVLVEFNLTSNLALNNIQTTRQVPLRRYLEAGVRVVLGSDGPGLYGTCGVDEGRAAIACGLTDTHLARLRACEDEWLARRSADAPRLIDVRPPPVLPRRHFTPVREAELLAARAARGCALDQTLLARDTSVSREPPRLRGRPLLWLAGAWRNAFAQWRERDVLSATRLLDEVLAGVAQRDGLVLTGGTHHGVEGIVHGFAGAHGVEVLGAIVDDTRPEDVDARVSRFWICARTLYEKAAPLVGWVRDEGGLGLFVGGGLIVADEQQAAFNLRVRHRVVADLPGPAVEAARASRHARFVNSAAEVLAALDDHTPPGRLRHAGANDAADVIVLAPSAHGREQVLLIRRHDDSGAASGRFSLPGGFCRPGEAPRDAAVRELSEETGLALAPSLLAPLCVVERGGRDPRDTDERWVRSHVFVARVPRPAWVMGGSDAAAALFVDVERVPSLAFDHDELLRRACRAA